MIVVWQIKDDLPNSPNFTPTIWYVAIQNRIVILLRNNQCPDNNNDLYLFT